MFAERVRTELGLGWERIEPVDVCAQLDIAYLEDDLGPSGAIAGAVVQSARGRLAIVVNKHVRHTERRRFTVAHELGHICFPQHQDLTHWCAAGDMESYRANQRFEQQANDFAAELLLPTRTLIERLNRETPSMWLFQQMANEFGMSLTATAGRVVTHAPHEWSALILSTPTHILWTLTSPSVDRRMLEWRKGPPGVDTLAGEFLHRPMRGAHAFRTVEPQAWFRRWPPLLMTINEESVCFPNRGWVLSYLELVVESSTLA